MTPYLRGERKIVKADGIRDLGALALTQDEMTASYAKRGERRRAWINRLLAAVIAAIKDAGCLYVTSLA